MKDISNYELEIVEVHVKDQFFSRRDQFYINSKVLLHSAVYTSKAIYHQGLKLTIANLKGKGGNFVNSGVVTNKTKLVYRTLSGQITILVSYLKVF